VTFKLESVPSSTIRDFDLSTDVGSPSSFILSKSSSTYIYRNVGAGSYEVTLPSTEIEGYDVAVSCVGSASSSTSGDTTTFDVIGESVICTFTLTGKSVVLSLCILFNKKYRFRSITDNHLSC
jgi:outer membrane receptor for Fe3+-dicitrate